MPVIDSSPGPNHRRSRSSRAANGFSITNSPGPVTSYCPSRHGKAFARRIFSPCGPMPDRLRSHRGPRPRHRACSRRRAADSGRRGWASRPRPRLRPRPPSRKLAPARSLIFASVRAALESAGHGRLAAVAIEGQPARCSRLRAARPCSGRGATSPWRERRHPPFRERPDERCGLTLACRAWPFRITGALTVAMMPSPA